ncbi:hypothetical protein [Kitasatospora sp. NBC_01302]|uniref:hypothetical protein n=1 Tax=Kitasatospora sp. NBC_01302 TaxID=2903575 RepID=UPI002E112372|nr:hypothetical protein OG294_13390 [Kitasatospora sp. NBC_01302]
MNDEFEELPDDEFRFTLSTELAALTPPPLGDLVAQATHLGRRQRRRRTFTAVAGSVTAVAAIASLLAFWPLAGGGPGRTVQQPAAAAPSSPEPSTSGLVPADGPALLAAALNALPIGGQSGNYTTYSGPNALMTRLDLTTTQGTGLVQVTLSSGSLTCGSTADTACGTSPDGDRYQVVKTTGNCIESTLVTVQRPNNLLVSIQLGTCLSWDPQKQVNPPGIEVLTVEQAIAMAQAPGFATEMPVGFVQAADAKYPNLPALS